MEITSLIWRPYGDADSDYLSLNTLHANITVWCGAILHTNAFLGFSPLNDIVLFHAGKASNHSWLSS